jgi:hypothetical protein
VQLVWPHRRFIVIVHVINIDSSAYYLDGFVFLWLHAGCIGRLVNYTASVFLGSEFPGFLCSFGLLKQIGIVEICIQTGSSESFRTRQMGCERDRVIILLPLTYL